jgi:hypothetical protein
LSEARRADGGAADERLDEGAERFGKWGRPLVQEKAGNEGEPPGWVSARSTLCLPIAVTQRYPPLARVKYNGSACYKEWVTDAEIERMPPLQAGALPGPMASTAW